MMIKILAINYSQSGQLNEIVDNFIEKAHSDTNIDIDRVIFKPKKDYPFPWTSDIFFNTMPESVLEEATELQNIKYKYDSYDYIILGYQPWYLSPSIPTSSLLQNDKFKSLLKNTKVITLIGARNMWLNAQESIKTHLKNAGAKLVANIPLVDRVNNQLSALTILYWMLTGKKESMYGILPIPGISQEDIDFTKKYGEVFCTAISSESKNLQKNILAFNKISIPTDILFIETRAKRLFKIWANIIKKKTKNRSLWVNIYKYYLLVALFIIAPILILIYKIFILPFNKVSIQKKKDYFCGLESD